jgi:hypothetical protein
MKINLQVLHCYADKQLLDAFEAIEKELATRMKERKAKKEQEKEQAQPRDPHTVQYDGT